MAPADPAGKNRLAGEGRPQQGPPLVVATILRDEGMTGVHTHVRELAAYLAGRGEDLDLVTPFSWGGALALPVFGARLALERLHAPAGVAWYRYWHEVFLRRALRRRLAGLGALTVYAQGPEAARAALWARSGPHQRVVMAVHYTASQADGWAEKGLVKRDSAVYRSIRKMERGVLPSADGIVYVSRWAQASVLSWLPEAGAVPSAVIPNFLVARAAAPTAGSRGDLVTVGSLDAAKRHHNLLRVLAQAKRLGRRYTLDVYGTGPLLGDLRRTASDLGVDAQVTFKGFRPDVRARLPAYRAYVHACLVETGPLAVIEAMAEGLPVLAPRSGGMPELYSDGESGLFWDPEDPVHAAKALVGLLDDESLRQRYSAKAREQFHAHFSADVAGDALTSFLAIREQSFATASRGHRPRAPRASSLETTPTAYDGEREMSFSTILAAFGCSTPGASW